jgi:hypothetical protein
MLYIQDSETAQLAHDQQANKAMAYLAQHPFLDFTLGRYYLLAVVFSLAVLSLLAIY